MLTTPHRVRRPARRYLVAAALSVAAVSLAACGTTAPLRERLELQAVANGSAIGGAAPTASGATGDGSTTTQLGDGDPVTVTGGGGAQPTAGTVGTDSTGGATTPGVISASGDTSTGGGTTTVAAGSGKTGAGPSAKAGKTGSAPSAKAGKTTPGGKTSPTKSPASAASAASTPIQLGFVSTDTSNSSSLGVGSGQTVSDTAVINAAVKGMNATGGVGGRQIQPIIATTDTGGANWATEFQAACSAFTEDNHVTAVLGYEFVSLDSFEQCLGQAKIPHLDEGYEVGGNGTFSTYPGLYSLAAPSVDRAALLQVAGALASGELTPKNKIGLMEGQCNSETAAYQNTVLPYIAQQHLDVAATVAVSCANGTGDSGAIAAQISAAVLKFESAGVDRVVTESVPAILFATTAESQGYHPDYLVTSTAGGAALEPNVPADQLKNFHGYGYNPAVDVDPAHQPAPSAAQSRCLSLMKAQGLVPQQYNDYLLMYTTCDSLFLYDAALKADGGRTDIASVTAAINGLGSSFASALALGGSSSLSPTQHADITTYQDFDWNTGCSCFEYDGSPKPIPTS